ncbi:PIG-L family deacetylase [Embleya hyalina]|uniref:PIG-L family deacetylase n=1 Tax=Embleya hyalina TaxID=516124 RepID=UPI001357C270|nr:PIG-L family deacetylase [Embleya hyalina]
MQIVAHQDDDLLFMNPDVSGGIAAGVDTTTIYLTAGEGATPDGEKDNEEVDVAYARTRQAGVMAAYARMAGLTDDGVCGRDHAGPGGCWTLIERSFPNGALVEEFTLDTWTGLKLVFLNLPELGKDYNSGSLSDLEEQGGEKQARTLDMDGDPNGGPWPRQYYRSDVVTLVSDLLAYYGATTVRAQDSAPDLLMAPSYPEGDHLAHIAASRFADAAVARYGGVHNGRVLLEHYRDYNIDEMPINLSQAQVTEKKTTFADYDERDDRVGAGYDDGWGPREYSRAPRGTRWMGPDAEGLLHAFVVEAGDLYEWSQDSTLTWHGPYAHGNYGFYLNPGLNVSRNADGRLEVFAQRRDTGEIVSRFQGLGGGWGWGALGSPNAGVDSLRVSSPVVVPNADGRLQVFVRHRGGGISTRWQAQPNGAWNGWVDMMGSGIQGPPAAVTTNSGRIELFAATTGKVLHWYQPAPNAPFRFDTAFPGIVAASGLSTGINASGRIELFYRQPGSAELTTLYQAQPDGGWLGPATITGAPGLGEPAAATSGGRIVTMVRNQGGGVSFSRQAGPDQPFGPWTDRGGLLVGLPAAAAGRDGTIALLTIGPGGQVFNSRENPDGTFSSWNMIG